MNVKVQNSGSSLTFKLEDVDPDISKESLKKKVYRFLKENIVYEKSQKKSLKEVNVLSLGPDSCEIGIADNIKLEFKNQINGHHQEDASSTNQNSNSESRAKYVKPSLEARVQMMERFVDPLAKRFLIESIRNKIWAYKKQGMQNYKSERWNALVESLTNEDYAALNLKSKDDLKITMFGDGRPADAFQKKRPFNEIDDSVSSTIHVCEPEYVAYMVIRSSNNNLRALFSCLYDRKSPEDYFVE